MCSAWRFGRVTVIGGRLNQARRDPLARNRQAARHKSGSRSPRSAFFELGIPSQLVPLFVARPHRWKFKAADRLMLPSRRTFAYCYRVSPTGSHARHTTAKVRSILAATWSPAAVSACRSQAWLPVKGRTPAVKGRTPGSHPAQPRRASGPADQAPRAQDARRAAPGPVAGWGGHRKGIWHSHGVLLC